MLKYIYFLNKANINIIKMTEDKIIISLVYNSIKKEIKIPKDYSNLLKSFLDIFNEDKNKIFVFYYNDEEKGPIVIDNKNFQTSLNIIKEKDNLTINVKIKNI